MASTVQLKNSILSEVGAGLDGSNGPERAILDLVTPNIDVFWDIYEYKNTYPMLQYHYVKLHCLNVVAGQLRTKIDKSLGPLNKRLSVLFANAMQLIGEVRSQIADIEALQAGSRKPVLTRLDVDSVFEPSVRNPFDPSQPRYTNDPSDPRYLGGR